MAEKSLLEKRNYLVTLPAQLKFPSTQKVCLDLSPGYSDVKFTVSLETKGKTLTLIEHSGSKTGHLHCKSFLVPVPSGGIEEVATVRVRGTGNKINFEERKKVLIQRQQNGIFIQTDKPVYNPGQQVLPKFKLEVVEPKQLSMVEDSFLVKICCRYTYGKPVLGTVKASVCQKAYNYWYREPEEEHLPDRCKNISGKTDKAGCVSASVAMSTFSLTGHSYHQDINIVATIVEEGTGVEANTTRDIFISAQTESMTFEDTSDYYYPNFPFSGKIRVRGHDGSPLKHHSVFLVIGGKNGTIKQTLTTDNEGLAPFKLDTVNWDRKGISLELIGKGNLEMEGQKHLKSKREGLGGSFSLSLTFNSRLAPDPSLVMYAIFPGGGVIADKIQFSVEMCFDNQVSLGFSPSQQLPGADVDLQLQAAPQSLCAIRAVDESVLLLRPESELSNSSVSGLLTWWQEGVNREDRLTASELRDGFQAVGKRVSGKYCISTRW
ncbi:Alpha-2-macroglobulin-like protein 1, partial [Eschrichtius robustus]|nr:Alpha-2-macroglobulin-like protein 1 [Eschrichtius robustus]